MDDMLVNNLKMKNHLKHLEVTFQILKTYMMMLNPINYMFGVVSKKFLCYMINQNGIKANLEKINALIEMRSPRTPKRDAKPQQIGGALTHFVSKIIDKCLPFFKILK